MRNSVTQKIEHILTDAQKAYEIELQEAKLLYLNGKADLLSYSQNEFEVRVNDKPDHFVKFNFASDTPTQCSCKEKACTHYFAALLRLKEHLKTEGQTEAKGYAYTRKGMVRRVLAERKEKAKKSDFALKLNKNIFGEHELTSESGQQYLLTLHDFKQQTGYCSCPDFKFNKLGTCKHLMYTFDYLAKHESDFERKTHFLPFIDVFLDPLNEYRVSYFFPHQMDLFAKSLFDNYFKGKTSVEDEDIPDLLPFFEEAESFGQIKIRPEVLEKVEAVFNEQALIRYEETIDFEAKFKTVFPQAKLLPYQVEGAQFATFREGAIIADDMGLGKTKQAVAAALMKRELLGFKRCLVVCPVSLRSQWETEIGSFGANLAAIADGSPEERLQIYSKFDRYFLIAGYETVVRDSAALSALNFDYIILDEAQRIKDYESKTATVIKRIPRKHALVITGTPIENRLIDLYSIVDFLDKRLLAPLWEFSYRYCFFDSHTSNKITAYQNLGELRERLSLIMIRREKSEVIAQLPNIREYNIPVKLKPEQIVLQKEFAEQLDTILQKSYRTPFDHQRMMQLIAKMRMTANSSYLLDSATNFSAKLDELEHILIDKLNLPVAPRKVVVFSEWKKMANIIAFALRRKGIQVLELNGDVPAAKRSELFSQFEHEAEYKVFVTTSTGGKGLNLQVADTIINFEIPQNPAERAQRTGRIDRLGQTENKLNVFNLIAENSIEQFIQGQQTEKQNLFDVLLRSDGESYESAFSKEAFTEKLKNIVGNILAEQTEDTTPTANQEIKELLENGVNFFQQLLQFGSANKFSSPKIKIEDSEIIIRIEMKK